MLKAKSKLGDFEILRELGRGGMGIVYEARQVSLNRKVALKVLGDSLGMTTKAVVRFRREAEAAAKLHHTNIVPIYATGEHEGTHYYAMELVEGPSLNLVIRNLQQLRREEPRVSGAAAAQSPNQAGVTGTPETHRNDPSAEGESTASAMPAWVARTLAPDVGSTGTASATHDSSSTLSTTNNYFDAVAKMIADVAEGLDYAHNHGVIHRDMKPSNLLLSPDGRLSINDFGLARMLEQPGMTMTGEFVGSPLYMSPEQITAGRAPLDHRTDIYSLGASLYELLTLAPPFPGERRDQIIGQIIHKEPKPPRAVNKKVPLDLETICLKAMEKDPDRRYQTAGQLAEDLRRYVSRFATSAKRAGLLGRTGKWVRRRPAVAAMLALVVVAGAVAALASYQTHLSNQRMTAMHLQKAMEDALLAAWSGEFDAAERHIQEAEQRGVSHAWARMLRGQVALYQDRPREAIQHLEQAVRLLPESVAARAMLVRAVLQDGRWDQCIMMLDELGALTPKTAEDYLFLG
ncbi:MAG: protein kinase domain-containing protein, partial [Candidatus Binataceae bacterium]